MSSEGPSWQDACAPLVKVGWGIEAEGLETIATDAEVGPDDARGLQDLLLNVRHK